MEKEIADKINGLTYVKYINTNALFETGGVPIYFGDMIKAALCSKLNVFLAGETGEGKSQLEFDVRSMFGNKGAFILGRNDMDVREMYKKVSGKKYHEFTEGKIDSDQIKELTGMLEHNIFVVDELTRCIPAVQNQLFNLFDGYIEVDGNIHDLGNGFCVGLASGNMGNGKYIGTSSQDRALLDRMHIILDIDNYPPLAKNSCKILEKAGDNPRVRRPEECTSKIDDFKAINDYLKKQELDFGCNVGIMYLRHGLDYVDGIYKNSKRANKNVWPNLQLASSGSHDAGSDAELIFPISTRSMIILNAMTKALTAVAEAKGAKEIDQKQLMFDFFKIAGCNSGILNMDKVNSLYNGSPEKAIVAVIEGIDKEFDSKAEKLFDAAAMIEHGKEPDGKILSEFTGRWDFAKGMIEYYKEKFKEEHK